MAAHFQFFSKQTKNCLNLKLYVEDSSKMMIFNYNVITRGIFEI